MGDQGYHGDFLRVRSLGVGISHDDSLPRPHHRKGRFRGDHSLHPKGSHLSSRVYSGGETPEEPVSEVGVEFGLTKGDVRVF